MLPPPVFTKRQLKDVAKKILAVVKLRQSAEIQKGISAGLNSVETAIQLSLPKDNLTLLACRAMDLPKSQVSNGQHCQCTLTSSTYPVDTLSIYLILSL